MVAEALNITRETYFAILLDRSAGGPVLVASPVGGVDIEDVAEKTPEKIFKTPIDIEVGLTRELAEKVADQLEFKGDLAKSAADQIMKLYEMFLAIDATQVEINPFGETDKGQGKYLVCIEFLIPISLSLHPHPHPAM